MSISTYDDLYDPEVLKRLIGVLWLNEPKFVTSGVVRRVERPTQGTLTTDILQKTFQGRKGQALKMNDEISATNKEQNGVNMPNLWRYDALSLAEAYSDIEAKEVDRLNADMSSSINTAAAQYVDDSLVATTEGISGSLTANQTTSGSTISLDSMSEAKSKQLDRVDQLNGGAMVMRSEIYHELQSQGLVGQSTNTFGNILQVDMVRRGSLPETVLGMTPIVTDKLAKEGGGDFYSYLIGTGTLVLKGDGSPDIRNRELDKSFVNFLKFKIRFGVGT
jgi:hypothetical protein